MIIVCDIIKRCTITCPQSVRCDHCCIQSELVRRNASEITGFRCEEESSTVRELELYCHIGWSWCVVEGGLYWDRQGKAVHKPGV